jgi:hypothetical protein
MRKSTSIEWYKNIFKCILIVLNVNWNDLCYLEIENLDVRKTWTLTFAHTNTECSVYTSINSYYNHYHNQFYTLPLRCIGDLSSSCNYSSCLLHSSKWTKVPLNIVCVCTSTRVYVCICYSGDHAALEYITPQ